MNIENNHPRNNILKPDSKHVDIQNWKVYNPSGRHMFTCGNTKANWYLNKNLATIVGDFEIQFTFNPKGDGYEDDEVFGRNERQPICVVSGLETSLQRHHIVPYCYRTHFPVKYKSKNHHDVVLINCKHHSDYEQEANIYKDEIAKMYGIKTISELNYEYTTMLREASLENGKLLNILHSLFRCYGKISQEDTVEKLKLISEESKIPFETIITYNYVQLFKMYQHVKELHSKEGYERKINYRMQYDHGYHLVQKLDSEEKIEEFVKLWRKHFIDTMNPQFMPIGWSVDFRIKTNL